MHKMISSHVRTCHECQLVKPLKVKERQPLEPITIRTHAWSDISIDILGGDLPRSNKGNKYLLVILCNASKFVHAIPIRNLRAETIATKLVEFFFVLLAYPGPYGVIIWAHFDLICSRQ